MKTLIIGGSGLISTAITRQLLDRGDDLILYNRGQTPLRIDGDVTVVRGDRTDAARFAEQLAALGPLDCVIDMVCFDPAEAASAVRACQGRVGQYIFCSSVTVYDKAGAGYPLTEEAPRDNPVGDYATKKARCEDIFLDAHRRGDLPVTILRPGSTYSEGHGIIHTFGGATTYLDRLRKGKPIIVPGDGQSLWVACHAHDVARGKRTTSPARSG
jgi:nucleoside-diphosphate-sugar epimerase